MDLNQEQQFGKAAAALQDQAGGLLGARAGHAADAAVYQGPQINKAIGVFGTTPVLRTIGDKLDLAIRQAEAEVVRLKSIKAETAHDLLSVNLDTFYRLKTF